MCPLPPSVPLMDVLGRSVEVPVVENSNVQLTSEPAGVDISEPDVPYFAVFQDVMTSQGTTCGKPVPNVQECSGKGLSISL